ncbi:Protein T01C8.2 [Aphelenchoides avenae]|nr:Protein T01C8.2 [Aphelenchus avenae]
MPKQTLDWVDYTAPLATAAVFGLFVFVFSFTIINWFCITRKDDLTVFERMGSPVNLRLGPHTMSVIRRGDPNVSSHHMNHEALLEKA